MARTLDSVETLPSSVCTLLASAIIAGDIGDSFVLPSIGPGEEVRELRSKI